MNAWQIAMQFSARQDRWRRNTVMLNYTPDHWWECDVFEITAAGYFVEYEIKVSRGDFFADAKKTRQQPTDEFEKITIYGREHEVRKYRDVTKHAMISDGKPPAPSRFFYLMPENLVAPTELPAWAGLIYFTETFGPRGDNNAYLRFRETVKAPVLHREKVQDRIYSRVRETCYWRMHDLLTMRQPMWRTRGEPYLGPEGAD